MLFQIYDVLNQGKDPKEAAYQLGEELGFKEKEKLDALLNRIPCEYVTSPKIFPETSGADGNGGETSASSSPRENGVEDVD